jgi:hypothetical protein
MNVNSCWRNLILFGTVIQVSANTVVLSSSLRKHDQLTHTHTNIHTTVSHDFTFMESATAIWEMRLQELIEYKSVNGHTSITHQDNPKLLVWVKCQRRQYKLYCVGQKSSMTPERISKLNAIGFCWNPRRGVHSGSLKSDGS